MDGLLVLDKPEGKTSFQVVAEVRRHLRTRKAGHTGTLDPMATGVLPICVGEATKVVTFILDADKEYVADVRLGAATDTQDRTGKVIAEAVVPALSVAALEEALQAFRGPIQQTPPMFSAIQVDGKRLYDLARAGQVVERESRPVTVHALELLSFASPDLRLRVRCSKGTYVRTLAHDLGERLGCHAHLTALRRTETCGFTLDQAVTLDELRRDPQAVAARLLTPAEAIGFLPAVTVRADLVPRLFQGQRLGAAGLGVGPGPDGQRVRMLSEAGGLLAVAQWNREGLQYLRVLAPPQELAGPAAGREEGGAPPR